MLRRDLLKGAGAGAVLLGAPYVWIPKAHAQAQCEMRNAIKHLLYVKLNGGFRFTAAYNGNVAAEFNPFGNASGLAEGTQWGASRAIEVANWTQGDGSEELLALGMAPLTQLSNRIAVIPCVDHEPFSGSADGNHGTGLERYYTGYADGDGYGTGGTSFFTMINYALRDRVATGNNSTSTALPAFVLGEAGMARGSGQFAGYRAPVLEGTSFEQFRNEEAAIPDWAKNMAALTDARMRNRQHVALQPPVEAYIQTREANERFNQIFQDPALNINDNSAEAIDGFTQAQLANVFGDSRAGRSTRLALRLFHFGCPAVFFGQGGWDMHSDEEARLEPAMNEPNRLMSGLIAILPQMPHPEGGTYWDHTLVVFGSEFGRTARGSRFNSARGSDHGGDLATRWMSMPMMGGVIDRCGLGGAMLGMTRSSDLRAEGQVVSYRSMMKTLMDMLGGDHSPFFEIDNPFNFIDLTS